MPWRLPDWVALILPLAVTENRFLQDDFVLSLGIFAILSVQQEAALACPLQARRLTNRRAYSGTGGDNASRKLPQAPFAPSDREAGENDQCDADESVEMRHFAEKQEAPKDRPWERGVFEQRCLIGLGKAIPLRQAVDADRGHDAAGEHQHQVAERRPRPRKQGSDGSIAQKLPNR